MSNTIEITFSVEDAAAFKAWQRQQAAAAKMKKELDALKNSGNQAGQSLVSAAGQAGRTALSAVAALTGIGGAVAAIIAVANQLKREWQNMITRQEGAAGTQIAWGKAFAGLQRAAGGLMERKKLQDRTFQGAINAGQDPEQFAKTVETTLQAKGPVTEADVERAIESAESVSKFYPEVSSEDRALLSGSTGDVSSAYKTTTEESLGLLQNVAQAARVEGPQFMAQNVAPAMAQMAMYGESPQFAGALMATTTNRTVDREGATSKLIDLKFLERLREVFPEEKTGLKTGEERLKYLQDNPQFHKAFLDGGTILGKKLGEAEIGRSAGRPFIEDLLKKDSESNKVLRENMGVVGDRATWQAQHDKVKAQVDADPNFQLGRLQAAGKAAGSQIQLDNTTEGQIAVARELLRDLTKAAGLLDIEQKAAMATFEANTALGGVGAVEEVARQLTVMADAEDHIDRPTQSIQAIGYGAPHITTESVVNPNATDEQKQRAARLRQARDSLQKAAPKSNAQVAVDSAKQAAISLESDKSITPAEAEQARGKVREANEVIRRAEASLDVNEIRELKGALFRVAQVIEAQIKSNDKNTEATEKLANTPNAPAAKSGSGPVKQTSSPVRNGQASRGLDRRNQYKSPQQFT